MTDDELREAAARALGWRRLDPRRLSRPPIDWTTAGALLELCAQRQDGSAVRLSTAAEPCSVLYARPTDLEYVVVGPLTARNVIEACVMALDTQSTTP